MTLFKKAGFELTSGRATAAIELVISVLEREGTGLSESNWQGYMIRARAHLVEGNIEACARDMEAILAILSGLGPIPREALDSLSGRAN